MCSAGHLAGFFPPELSKDSVSRKMYSDVYWFRKQKHGSVFIPGTNEVNTACYLGTYKSDTPEQVITAWQPAHQVIMFRGGFFPFGKLDCHPLTLTCIWEQSWSNIAPSHRTPNEELNPVQFKEQSRRKRMKRHRKRTQQSIQKFSLF